jgi:hypothetical protein
VPSPGDHFFCAEQHLDGEVALLSVNHLVLIMLNEFLKFFSWDFHGRCGSRWGLAHYDGRGLDKLDGVELRPALLP